MKVYLSPSNQPRNMCALGHSEKQHCEQLAQMIRPLLQAKGIECKIRPSSGSMSSWVAEATAWGADLYIPIHTNAAGGTARGTRFGFYPGRNDSQEACKVFRDNFKKIYPIPDRVVTCTYTFYEAKSPKCPSVYCETIFHDNLADATWFHENMERIAQNFSESAELYLKPKEEIIVDYTGHNAQINTTYDAGLSLWSTITRDKALIQVRKGETVYIIKDHNPESSKGWATAEYKGVTGFVDKQYLIDKGAVTPPAPEPTPEPDDTVQIPRAEWEAFLLAFERVLKAVG